MYVTNNVQSSIISGNTEYFSECYIRQDENYMLINPKSLSNFTFRPIKAVIS